MLTLKTYQQNALDALAAYCRLCVATGDPDLAFYQSTRLHFQHGIPYCGVPELPGLPYVCIRIPTGGKAIGALWSERSAGQCRFVMPKGQDFAAIAAQLQ